MHSAYSLWLVPDRTSSAYNQLDELISEYAAQHTNAPDFEPHVTVLGNLQGNDGDIEDRTRSLATASEPIPLSLTSVQCSTTTHQCVFVLVEPTKPILHLRRDAVRSFETEPAMHVPHVSLLYSDMPIEERIHVAESITRESLPDRVTATTLAVVATDGPVESWDPVDDYPL